MSVYQGAIEDLDQRIARLQAARAVLVDLSGPGGNDATVRQIASQGRVKVTGTHALVLAMVKDGNDTIAGIAKAAKIKESTARVSVLQLETAGKIARHGKGRSTRYVIG